MMRSCRGVFTEAHNITVALWIIPQSVVYLTLCPAPVLLGVDTSVGGH